MFMAVVVPEAYAEVKVTISIVESVPAASTMMSCAPVGSAFNVPAEQVIVVTTPAVAADDRVPTRSPGGPAGVLLTAPMRFAFNARVLPVRVNSPEPAIIRPPRRVQPSALQ